ncbi:MAG: glycosyltransferase [Candidatus Pacebacteria bacterium]|nr:glycosyltransferase [Candidatus Paceibacterota bacterium]
MKSHVVIIRMHYQEHDKRFPWRLAYFQAMVYPRLMNQTDKNFDIAIRCNQWQEEAIKRIDPRIITFQTRNQTVRYRMHRGKKYFYDFCKWKDVMGLRQYDIQTGLDSDDLVSRCFIERIKSEVNNAEGKKSLHISFQPELFELKTLKTRSITTKYGPKKGSAFLSLYQPNKKNYKFIYEESHLDMWRHAKKSIIIPEGYCWATAHGLNESTRA